MTETTMKPADLKPGDFISIPQWNLPAALVDDVRPGVIGSDDARVVLLYETPESTHRSRYHLEPGQFDLV